ncbi:MAG: hypothetical protein ACR2IE_13465 [Candidatus Sumerlaeaceae bacterium]
MRSPLLWKELRENRVAIILGLVWVLASVLFWFEWAHVKVPWPMKVLLEAAAMVAPGVSMLLLGCARFFIERRNGSWDFMQSQPASIRRVIAIKWAVAVGIGVVSMGLSSASTWFPMTHMETRLAHVPLIEWVTFHAVAAALLISILLLLDTVDWAEWLGVRALVSFGIVLPFFGTMSMQGYHSTWRSILICGALAATCATIAIGAGPVVARESPLPIWRLRSNVGMRRYSSTGAWMWLQWRQMRFVTFLLLLPVPLLLVVNWVAGASGSTTSAEAHGLFREIAGTVGEWSTSALMCCCAMVIGYTIPLMESQSQAESFRWSLPLSRARVQWQTLSFAIGLLVIVFIPTLLLAAARVYWFAASYTTLFVSIVKLFCVSAAICTLMLIVSSFAIARQMLAWAAIPIGIAISAYVMNHVVESKGPDILWLLAGAGVMIVAAVATLPEIDRRREI